MVPSTIMQCPPVWLIWIIWMHKFDFYIVYWWICPRLMRHRKVTIICLSKLKFLQFTFSSTRSIEDEQVAEMTIEVWQCVVKVITHWCVLPSRKRPKENKSNDVLVEHHKDSFMLAKLPFFKHIASTFKYFLTSFTQCHFLYYWKDCEQRLMLKFVNKDVLVEADTANRFY